MLAVRTTSLLFAFSTLVIVLSSPVRLAGQDSATGSIRGTVADPAGARVTPASIVVVTPGQAHNTRQPATPKAISPRSYRRPEIIPLEWKRKACRPGLAPHCMSMSAAQRVAITSNGMIASAGTLVQDSVTANIAPYPGYYKLPNDFMKPNAAYAPRQIQLARKFVF